MYLDCIYFRVAGVSFNNDNGTSRQRYISKLKPFDALGMTSFEYEGNTAFHILDEHGHCIGNLPKEHVDFVLDHYNQGHKITLYITDILGLDEDGHRIDGYNLGVEVCLDVHDDRPDPPKERTEPEPSAVEDAPAPKKKQKTGRVMIGFGVFFALGFFVAFNPVVLIIAALLLFFGIRRHKAFKASENKNRESE